MKRAWPFVAAAIPAAYMASVEVYKIWYITTSAVLALSVFAVRFSFRDIGNFIADTKWFILYWLAVLVSVWLSTEPVSSQFALTVDSIYPAVFAIFYYVGLRYPSETITLSMRLQVWAAVVILALTMDVDVGGRIGYRILFILPYVVPFIVADIYRGKKLALVELCVTLALLLVTTSRVPFAAACILAVLSAFLLRRSTWQFVKLTLAAALTSAALLFVALQIPPIKVQIYTTAVRITGQPLYLDGAIIPAEPEDMVRVKINDLYSVLTPDAGATGVGYAAFAPIFGDYWRDGSETPLHSIYQVWRLEMGWLGLAVALIMLADFFVRAAKHRHDPAVVTAALAFLGTLLTGMFHQMHQAPMFYVMLGVGLGACRKTTTAKSI